MTDVFVAFPGAAGPVMALRGADLTVAAGEHVVVQGPNGSGKTTLCRVITGEQPVAAGAVEVGGTALQGMTAAQRRQWRARTVGFVDQHARRGLLPEVTVADNVALQLRLTGLPASQAQARAAATLQRLGLAELATRAVGELSGGEAQRVAVCAAVAHDPQLVLADEPTGELDEESARQVYEMLAQITGSGASLILVSHDRRADRFADRTVRIRDGRLAEQWTPSNGGSQPPVEQVRDSHGWLRVPPELLSPIGPGRGLVATAEDGAVLLRPPGGALLRPPGGALLRPPRRAGHSARADPAEVEQRAEPAPYSPSRTARPLQGGSGRSTLAELRHVTARYPGRRPLFESLDLTVQAGTWVAVTGPSGSGKSTLLALVAGLVDPVAGEVSISSVDWAGLDRRARAELRRRCLTFAPQRPSLVEALTVRENLRLSGSVRGVPMTEDDVTAVAARLGLVPLLPQPVAALSGGERQRVVLARCLAADAPLLVLDEPTSQQDEESATRVLAAFAEETATGRAVLAASHDPGLLDHASHTVEL